MDYWAHQVGVKLDFIRPGKPVENSYIESFNGRLRDECLNVEMFLDLTDAQSKIQIIQTKMLRKVKFISLGVLRRPERVD